MKKHLIREIEKSLSESPEKKRITVERHLLIKLLNHVIKLEHEVNKEDLPV